MQNAVTKHSILYITVYLTLILRHQLQNPPLIKSKRKCIRSKAMATQGQLLSSWHTHVIQHMVRFNHHKQKAGSDFLYIIVL